MLVQSEYGDIYRVTLNYTGSSVTEVSVKYFDTIPTCASLCVLKSGFLFAASEAGDHALYQFTVRTSTAQACQCTLEGVLLAVRVLMTSSPLLWSIEL